MYKWSLFAISLFFYSFIFHTTAQISKGDNFSYTITDTWLEGSSGSVEMIIQQSGEKAIATFPTSSKLKQVSYPSAGIKSARPDKNIPVLVNIIEETSSFNAGDQILVDGRAVTIESISHSLEKGKEKTNLLGMKANQSILKIDLIWSEGNKTKGHYTGVANLWTIKKLPFSWLPYTIPDGFTKAVIPLSFNVPDLASHILIHYEEALKKKGLLVKADIEYTLDQNSDGFEMKNIYTRKVEVSDLKPITGNIAEIPDKTLISSDQYKYIFGALMLAGRNCEKEVGKASFQLEKEGALLKSIHGIGTAEIVVNEDQKPTSLIAMGVLNQKNADSDNGCMIIGIKPQQPTSGIYYMSTPNSEIQDNEAEPNLDFAFIVNAENENPVITYLEDGRLEFTGNEDLMDASLQGLGWSFKMSKTTGEMTQGVQVNTTFDLELKAKNSEIEVPDWTPISFEPGSMSDPKDLTLDYGPAVYGSMDAFGTIAAYSLKDHPVVKVLNLENGEEISTIELPMSSGTMNMSLSMAPSGAFLGIGITGGKVLIANPHTGKIINQWQYPPSGNAFTEVNPLAFNEKRNQVIGSSKGHLVVWDVESGDVIHEWEETTRINDIGVTPDGNYTLRMSGNGLKVYDLETGVEVCTTSSGGPALTIHPDGQSVATIDYSRKVYILDIKNCSEITSWQVEKGWSPKISWSADGEYLLMSDYSTGEIMIYDANTGEIMNKKTGEKNSRVYTTTHNNEILLVGPKILLWE